MLHDPITKAVMRPVDRRLLFSYVFLGLRHPDANSNSSFITLVLHITIILGVDV